MMTKRYFSCVIVKLAAVLQVSLVVINRSISNCRFGECQGIPEIWDTRPETQERSEQSERLESGGREGL